MMTQASNHDQLNDTGSEFVCCSCDRSIVVLKDNSPTQGGLSSESESGLVSSSVNEIIASPLCSSCMQKIVDRLKDDIADANNDLSKYTEALFELERERRRIGCPIEDEIEQGLSLLTTRESALQSELAELQNLESQLHAELAELRQQEEKLIADENALNSEIVNLNRAVMDSDESTSSVNRKLMYCTGTLKKLKKFNLINEAFFIEVGEPIMAPFPLGSINGLRIGKLGAPIAQESHPLVSSKLSPTLGPVSAGTTFSSYTLVPTSWSEINAGLGFMCLLVDVLVKRVNLNLSQYRLLPRGSYSMIIKKADRSALEFYSSESANAGGGLTRFLSSRKFDSAMIAFVQIVSELVGHIQKSNKSFRVPYPIDEKEGKIGTALGNGFSVNLQFNSENTWNQAMKMLLMDLKSVVGFVADASGT